ncbi:MAG: hypothetical protein RI897_4093 [Verrucomicrobiota bacterium]
MRTPSVMLIAGEASGDLHASRLVQAMRRQWALSSEGAGSAPIDFFGAGGGRMAKAGVRLVEDMTAHSVFGFMEAIRKLRHFRALGKRLLDLASREQPDVIILVDFGGFNLRFASAVRRLLRSRRGPFGNWSPKLVYFISPQVWASRAGRADRLAGDMDLLLSIFPFEKPWYAKRVPGFRVEFVGHPLVDVFASEAAPDQGRRNGRPLVLLLPGSRRQELRRHLPVLAEAVKQLQGKVSIRVCMVLPNESLFELASSLVPCARIDSLDDFGPEGGIQCLIGDATEAMRVADLALTKSGSVTLECAFHRLPAVVIYRLAWLTWWIARSIVQVPYVAMPNLLAGRAVYPELLQGRANAEAIAHEAETLLRGSRKRLAMVKELEEVRSLLGGPGACERAASHVIELLAVKGERA